jgi:hypothetical protein
MGRVEEVFKGVGGVDQCLFSAFDGIINEKVIIQDSCCRARIITADGKSRGE